MNDFSQNITLSSTRISLLEPLKIKLDLTYPNNYEPDLNTLRSHLMRQFILLSEEISPPLAQNGNFTQTMEWSVEAQRAGKKMITLYNIPFLPKGKGKPVELISGFYPVEVYLPKVDLSYEGELAPLRTFDKTPPITISRENKLLETPDRHKEKIDAKTFSYPSIFALCLPFILALLGYYFWSKPSIRRKLAAIAQQDPEEAALNSLQKIEEEPLPENEYYTKMSSIVRRFIEERYQLNASVNTSQECLQKLHIKREEQEVLQTFFQEADQVKYAHHAPSLEERKITIDSAKKFIKGTNK